MTLYSIGQDIYMRQGDTGNIGVNGFATDKTYTAYLSVYDEAKNRILAEIQTSVVDGSAVFSFTEEFSNTLPVGEWTYGIKACSGSGDSLSEDTLLPRTHVEDGALINEPAPIFTVDYKYVKGANE